jgi:GNAT superfamily N-acetyltransferase
MHALVLSRPNWAWSCALIGIAHLELELRHKPSPGEVPGIRVRTYEHGADAKLWLELRNRSFAQMVVRPWDSSDFDREFMAKPWWRPEHMWFAESIGTSSGVGTVTLAFRGSGNSVRPVVHWLAVLPPWRRRGIGELLMSVLEARVWELGYRQVCLETHRGWVEAMRFYQARGYREASVDDAAP